MIDTSMGMHLMYITDNQMGMHTHALGLVQSAEVQLDEGTCNSNVNHYILKAQIEGHSVVFVYHEWTKENILNNESKANSFF